MVLLIGDVFNASGYISYLGAFTGQYRNNILADWMKLCHDSGIPVSDDFTLQKVCASAVEVREWNIQGLPTLVFVGTDTSKPALRTEGMLPAEMVKTIIANEL
mgnify:CR=1 FL=1